MIERYTRKEMGSIWTLENKFDEFLNVELAVCKAYNKLGEIPEKALKDIEEKARFSVERIEEIENEVKHDVIAFLTCVNENIGENSRFVHMGLTSSDVIDTALFVRLKKANDIIEQDIKEVISSIKLKAKEHKNTICIGRSHGVHAEPMTFGIKLCSWLDIMERNLDRFCNIKEKIKIGQISGPIGTYSNINPKIEELVCKELELKPAKISTQIIARDFIAEYMQVLAIIATCIEQFATEIRHLQRSEVLEVEEGFSKNQKGSSAMPHKKNPVSSENLCGLARVIRSNSFAALEDVPLWHERDISHSSVERIILPDSTILIDYMLNRFKNVIDNLVINKDNMLKNTFLFGGCVYSQKVLLALCQKGLSREEAYKIVQENALSAWNKENGNFKQNLLNSKEMKKYFSDKEIEELFSVDDYLKNIDVIYNRFGI